MLPDRNLNLKIKFERILIEEEEEEIFARIFRYQSTSPARVVVIPRAVGKNDFTLSCLRFI